MSCMQESNNTQLDNLNYHYAILNWLYKWVQEATRSQLISQVLVSFFPGSFNFVGFQLPW